MTARPSQTSPRLPGEHVDGVFLVSGDTSPPPPAAPPAASVFDPLTRRVIHILSSVAHGSPSAPVCFGPSQLLQPALAEAFRRATARRYHHHHTDHHARTKGTT